jgi:hypothetical protein
MRMCYVQRWVLQSCAGRAAYPITHTFRGSTAAKNIEESSRCLPTDNRAMACSSLLPYLTILRHPCGQSCASRMVRTPKWLPLGLGSCCGRCPVSKQPPYPTSSESHSIHDEQCARWELASRCNATHACSDPTLAIHP